MIVLDSCAGWLCELAADDVLWLVLRAGNE